MMFKVGDKVRVVKCTDENLWVPRMYKTIGKVYTVRAIDKENKFYGLSTPKFLWWYREDDLELFRRGLNPKAIIRKAFNIQG